QLDMQIAALARAQLRHAFALEAEAPPGLCAGGDGDLRAFAVDGWDFQLAAEGCFEHRRVGAAVEIGAFAFEQLVRLHREEEVKVARRAAAGAGVAFAGEADARAVFNARGDFDRERALFLREAAAVAGLAGVLDGLPTAMAGGAGAHHAEHALAG